MQEENHQMRKPIEIESGTNTILAEADDIQYLAQAYIIERNY
jgi:hypothetical protein